ncbi:MAG TPA: hypothetical protein P5210_01810, partial [Draconibacterium sp.]|nr:hypothetical protein [Draconibacterium sp.]
MVDGNTIRLSKLAREYNVGIHTIVDFLHKKGFKDIDTNPNTKVNAEAVQLIEKEYKTDISIKKESEKISLKSHRPKKESISIDDIDDDFEEEETEEKPAPKVVPEKKEIIVEEVIIPVENINKFKVVGKIDLNASQKPKKKFEVEKRPLEKPVEPKVEKEPEIKIEKQPEPEAEKEPEEVKPVKQEVVKDENEPKVPKEEVPEKTTTPEVEIYVHNPRVSNVEEVKVVGMIDLKNINQRTRPAKKSKEEKEKERKERNKIIITKQSEQKPEAPKSENDNVIRTNVVKLNGPTVLGKINLPEEKKEQGEQGGNRKKRRKRISKENGKVVVDRK